MAIDAQLLAFMPHTVTLQNFSSFNNFGEENHSETTRTAKAYVEPNFSMSTQLAVREQSQPKRVYIADTNIDLRTKITLPDGSVPDVVSVEKHLEVLGLEHTVVTLG
jgi:hypothetical protein